MAADIVSEISDLAVGESYCRCQYFGHPFQPDSINDAKRRFRNSLSQSVDRARKRFPDRKFASRVFHHTHDDFDCVVVAVVTRKEDGADDEL